MYFAAMYDLNEGQAEAQARERPAHFAHAATGLVRIVMAGPTVGDAGTVNGGLYVFEAPDWATARRFCEEDPYTKGGIWRVLSVREFDKKVG
ncbi:YciI family protein [Sphingomonas crusticola]|uniref:YciI family protein n=1 Tax=Sphingomonas crusticola TaxID=1697973 RepID=UPI000E26CB69|nr:YciI family protein [Sphingomonas crusticola]